MILEIISPEKIIFTGEVESVAVPGVNGEFEMLNNHAAIVSNLKKGAIKVYGNITLDDTQKEIFEKTMVERGEILFSRGDMLATVRTKDGLSDIPAILPVRMYINPQKKTFTIVEYHTDYNTMCVLAFGNNWSSVGTSM